MINIETDAYKNIETIVCNLCHHYAQQVGRTRALAAVANALDKVAGDFEANVRREAA